MEKKLIDMVSQKCYNEIKEKVKYYVGEEAFPIVFPAFEKALEEGSGNCREEILISFLDMDSCRVCSNCGAIMEEGWYLDCNGYACSDECCRTLMNVSKEEYDRYNIYLPEIKERLKEEGDGRKPEDLSEEEIKELINEIIEGLDAYYYTEWH